MKLYNKDCMEMFSEIGDASVDLFIFDVPYKTTASVEIDPPVAWCEIPKYKE